MNNYNALYFFEGWKRAGHLLTEDMLESELSLLPRGSNCVGILDVLLTALAMQGFLYFGELEAPARSFGF